MKTPKRKHCDIYKCEKCGGYGITFTADDTTSALYQCTLCGTCWHMPGLPKRTRAIRARMKRKNREARQKNTIRHLKQTIAELEHDCRERGEAVEELLEQHKQAYLEIEALKSANREIAVWLKELCEQKEPTLLQTRPIDRLVKLYAHKRHRVPYSTYGHDVEGS